MPRDSGGVYSLPVGYLAVTGTTIEASQHNPPLEDIAASLTGSVPRNGTAGMLANLPMGGYKITGLEDGTSPTHAVSKGQLDALETEIFSGTDPLTNKVLVTPTITTSATLTATNDGATGAQLIAQHISASPAASDVIFDLLAQGKDSGANTDTYGNIQHVISDPTATEEDSYWSFLTRVAGTLAERLRIAAGIVLGAATGGDKGAGTLNATAVYVNGARLGGAPDAVIEDQKASGTDGGTATTGSWQTRTLNTEVRDPSNLISISSNQFTPTVDGWVEWSAPTQATNLSKTRLYNVTDSTVAGVGTAVYNQDASSNYCFPSFGGAPVVAGKAYRLEHQVGRSQPTNGYGSAAGFGAVEVYSRVLFWRTT